MSKPNQRRKAATIRALQAALGEQAGDAEHYYNTQIRPQQQAAELRRQGHDVEVALVNVNPKATGFKVRCAKCGRRARLPFKPPEGKVVVCPRCGRDA